MRRGAYFAGRQVPYPETHAAAGDHVKPSNPQSVAPLAPPPSITRIAWAVHPGRATERTRPEKLVAYLRARGLIAEDAAVDHHGRGTKKLSLEKLWPGRSVSGAAPETAVLSPVFIAGGSRAPIWVDLYDDWSLAPDINPLYRGLAASGYRSLRRGKVQPALVTVNSPSLADRIRPCRAEVVPNGVDESLADLELSGDERPRLLLLGHFFSGRTDFALLRQLCLRPEFEEICVCGPGQSPTMQETMDHLRPLLGDRLRVHDWADDHTLASFSGPRTIAAIPHVVTDYTVSQDLMKVYQLLALGVRVICPRLLWPASVSIEYALLLEHGVSLDLVLSDWLEAHAPSREWRYAFVREHSWSARANAVADLLEEELGA